MRHPLISGRPGEVSHVFCRNGAFQDRASAVNWVENGAVPRVQLPQGPPVWGFGPFSDTNYFSLGTGSDALDFAGDFSACVIYQVGSSGALDQLLLCDKDANNGWRLDALRGGNPAMVSFFSGAVQTNVSVLTVVPDGQLAVLCFGRAGTTGFIKVNLGLLQTGPSGPIAAGTLGPAMIGRDFGAGIAATSTIMYESCFYSTTPSDPFFTGIMQEVKGKLGSAVPW